MESHVPNHQSATIDPLLIHHSSLDRHAMSATPWPPHGHHHQVSHLLKDRRGLRHLFTEVEQQLLLVLEVKPAGKPAGKTIGKW